MSSIQRQAGMVCPICGAKDWCGYIDLSDGKRMYMCMRDEDSAHAAKHSFYASSSEESLKYPGWKNPIQFKTRQTSHGRFVYVGRSDGGFGRYLRYEDYVEEKDAEFHEWVKKRMTFEEEGGYIYLKTPYTEILRDVFRELKAK